MEARTKEAMRGGLCRMRLGGIGRGVDHQNQRERLREEEIVDGDSLGEGEHEHRNLD